MPKVYRCVCYPRRSQWDSLNLDLDDKNILFHVSIRPDAKRIVVTALVDGVWGTERLVPFDVGEAEALPLTIIVTDTRAHLLIEGEWRASVALPALEGRTMTVRASMPWTLSAAFGPFVPGAVGEAWLPNEGIGAEALRGFLEAPGWAGGPVSVAIGAAHFQAQAMSAPTAPDLPLAFVVPLDAAARQALAAAAAEAHRPTAVRIDFGAAGTAEGWIHAPGCVETLADGRIAGWVRGRGAAPHLLLLANGRPVPIQLQLGGAPNFPGDSRIATPRERGPDGYAPERPLAFAIPLPPALRAAAAAGQPVLLQVLGDGAELFGGRLALGGASGPAAPAEPTPAASEEPPPALAVPPPEPARRRGAVEVLRMVVPPGVAEDRWIEIVAPNGDVLLHLRYRAARNWLAANAAEGGVWGLESVLLRLPSHWDRLVVDVEIGAGHCMVVVNHVPVQLIEGAAFGSKALRVTGGQARFLRREARRAPAAPVALAPDIAPGEPPIGAIDRITRDDIYGWALNVPADAPLLVDLGTGPVALTLRWEPLPGLAARLGLDDPRSGFAARLPAELRHALARRARQARFAIAGRALSLPPAWTSAVTEVDGFVLRGEVIGTAAGATPTLGLRLAGQPLDVAVACWEKPALPPARGGGGGPRRHGFAIELPGTIWSGLGPEEGAALDVTRDGRVMEPARLLLSRGMAQQALARAAERGDATPEAQAGALLALEHLAFGRFLPDLPEPIAAFHRDLAKRYGLEGFVAREAAPAAPGGTRPVPPMPPEDGLRVAVWRALRALAARLDAQEDAPLFEAARAVAAERALQGEARQHFWFALVPNLAASDELPRLEEEVPLATWFHHEAEPNAWVLSSAVAILAASGRSVRATEALYRLAGATDGWINTVCIGFALRQVDRLAAQGQASATEVERFQYAFLGLLDAFKGDWFSRLHDRHFVEGMVRLLGRRHRMADYLAQDVERAALRHYGLAPAFWRLWRAGPGRAPADQTRLGLAERRFRAMQTALARPEAIDARLGALHDATALFRAAGNPEALVWQRELAAHALRPGSAAQPAALARLLAGLAAADPRDGVRILAMPGLPAPGGLANLGLGPEGLRDILREMRPQPRGMGEHAQRALCRLLANPALHGSGLAEATALAEMLGAARFGHVGADALALLAARSPGFGPAAMAPIAGFRAALLRMLEEVASPHLPAPFLAGLARIARLAAGGRAPEAAEALAALRGALAERFGDRHDLALSPVAAPALAVDPAAIAGDVLVCVYSCRKYLDSRVAAIRATWMRDLAPLGARCIVVVGDGDDTLEGDVLRLAVSDAYEDLPAKTLRMVEWVHANTDAQYLIKVDDDCALSAANYFGTLEYRAHHYYGRLLERQVGGTDRVWHHLKSHSPRARSIDRSPEPSVYCDGGGVYALSRYAMGRLLAAVRRPEGQALIGRSFMEDKLVGDLLALEAIAPVHADYESYQRRRSFGAAVPVGIYENTFFPSALAPAKVAHLDSAQDQARAHALMGQAELSPKKLWPSFTGVGTDYTAHQLELMSPPEVLARAQAEPIGVVLAARNEMTMLPHLLDHYRGLGVRAFYAVDNVSDDGSREWLLAQPDVVVYSAAGEYRTSHYGVTWQQTVLGHHFLGRWAVVADADEFLIYPGWRQRGLAELVAAVEAEGADAVPLRMVDMYPFGSLEEADFATRPPFEAAPWMDQPPVQEARLTRCFYSNRVQQVSGLRHRLLPDSEPNSFVAEKVALLRYQPWLRVSEGLHSAANVRLSTQPAVFAHFKYHAGFRRKILEEIARGQHFNGAAEYRRYAAMIAESFGAFGREGLSARLDAEGFVPGG
jgi:hypothetical protein